MWLAYTETIMKLHGIIPDDYLGNETSKTINITIIA